MLLSQDMNFQGKAVDLKKSPELLKEILKELLPQLKKEIESDKPGPPGKEGPIGPPGQTVRFTSLNS